MPQNIFPRYLLYLSLIAIILLHMTVPTLIKNRTVSHAGYFLPNFVTARPQYTYAGLALPGAKFACKTSKTKRCYAPQEIQGAYSIRPLLNAGITGKGSTIVLVDAFQSPTIEHDLQLFNRMFDLPDANLNIIAPDGLTPFNLKDPNQVSWAGEITLDVEWAHAIAPDATVDLVLAKSNQDADILSAIRYTVDHDLGGVLSLSFGEGETCVDPQILLDEHRVFLKALRKRITVLASSGDEGASASTCDNTSIFRSVDSPASDPFVTAVGGTQLLANNSGTHEHEVAWNEASKGGSGGGFSTLYRKPDYQKGIDSIKGYRGVPDVAYNAAINGGVLTVWSLYGKDQAFAVGGTSASAPQWAGIVALGTQIHHGRLGFLNPALYSIARSDLCKPAFHDINSGNNTFAGLDIQGHMVSIQGYSARKGWDAVTGWGSPIADNLLPPLINAIPAHPQDVSYLP